VVLVPWKSCVRRCDDTSEDPSRGVLGVSVDDRYSYVATVAAALGAVLELRLLGE
jgi:hypothetical protein